MKKSIIKTITPKGQWKEFWKFEIEFEDGNSGRVFKVENDAGVNEGDEVDYTINEKGTIKIIKEGYQPEQQSGQPAHKYSDREQDREKLIVKQSMMKGAIEWHIAKGDMDEGQLLHTAQNFVDWVFSKELEKNNEVPF
jgi:hypothetical protein